MRQGLARTLGLVHPLVTTLEVLGTANHYLMDTVAGVMVMGIGFALARPVLRTVDAPSARRRAAKQAVPVDVRRPLGGQDGTRAAEGAVRRCG
ncbi:phosphatase PAP2 family protein [Streptomyces sp. Li-HN-5-11]|uniref:phosphatase PAP2 family protein n=1 Tax=Streptomyces sp. Li-HN-5-11 TaxID=3075432 RepID=UPI0037DA345E